jgi:hypothetical protein
MSSPTIEAFLIDEVSESKFASHGLRPDQIIQVLENLHIIIPNRKERRGLFLVIGRDRGGACIAIPIEPTHDKTIWHPITAWPCKQSEDSILKQKRGNK